ncbi:conserved protein, unknown function [Hepatocystis sp. ex Piliocolobus tephrosceles]|nr:conserved protein, unknown function [Hepatocystis sp. ex Piliocolobus tephrosceles]
MDRLNTSRCDLVNYTQKRYYNPKIHVSGWYDIQYDETYIENYNRMKNFYATENPSPKKTHRRNKKMNNQKNYSDGSNIFYQHYDTAYWTTENKSSYKPK